MAILVGFLYVIEVIVCLMLALVVMLQKPKDGGLGGAIGGGMLEASLGADAGNVLVKTTAILGAIFLANTLVLARLTSTQNSHSVMSAVETKAAEQQAPSLPPALPEPVVPAAPAPTKAAPAIPAAPAKAPAVPAPAKAPAAPAKPAK